MRGLINGLVVGMAFALGAAQAVPVSALEVNQPAPHFTLTDSKGQAHQLADFAGKYVVLEWVNYECPFVRKQYDTKNMQALQRQLTADGVVWLSVNSSAEGKQGYFSAEEINRRIAAQEAAPTSYLMDSDGTVGRLYGAQTTPHIFLISPEGTLIYQGAIDDQPGLDHAIVGEAENYLLRAYNEARAGQPVSLPATKSYGCSVKY